ncbi:MAG: hypothetical protein WC763_01780 [Candidatus Paceibacterota bacterium]|jgi:uncharacterized protein with FMN-binding domain
MKKVFTFLAALAVIGGGVWFTTKGNDESFVVPADSSATSSPETSTPASATSTVTNAPADKPKATLAYKDGVYTAVGTYGSPAGAESISITLTIKDDVVTSASAVNQARDDKSVRYQDKFISGFKAAVIGQGVDSLKLTKVSGSSLTPAGFNAALEVIKVQAKA